MKIIYVDKTFKREFVKITFDNMDSLIITQEDFFAKNLYENLDLNENEIENLKLNCTKRLAKSIALKFIMRKRRTKMEVVNKLKDNEFDQLLIENIVEEFTNLGYIDDEDYIKKYINDCINLKPKAIKKIEYELLRKGIDRDLLSVTLLNYQDDEFAVAYKISEKRFKSIVDQSEIFKKKLFYFLLNRGFDYDIIKKVYAKMKNEDKDKEK